jgi:centrin-1
MHLQSSLDHGTLFIFIGAIDLRELKAAMRALGFEIKKEELRSILHDIGKDVNENNAANFTITLDDFISLMSSRMSSRDTREEIEKIFRLFDEEGEFNLS